MDELIRTFQLGESVTPVVTVWTLILGTLLSAALSMSVALVYRRIHSETTYSQTFVHTMVLLSVIVCFIMLVIGSNIARAFSLVGALSIIRFRTAIRSPLDVGFLFFTMAIGMGAGTRFYAVTTVATIMICALLLFIYKTNFAALPPRREYLLSVQFHRSVDYESALDPLLGSMFDSYSLAYVETVRQGALNQVVYSVRASNGLREKQVCDEISRVNDNLKINFRTIRHAIEIP